MAYYTFGDVLRYNDLTRNQLNRWTQAGLIRPTVVAGESLRRFSARNLVEAAVLDEIRGFGLSEVLCAQVIASLQSIWDHPDSRIDERPNAPTFREASILWIGFVRFTLPPDDEMREHFLVRPADLELLGRFLVGGDGVRGPTWDEVAESGIAVPLHRLIRELEIKTGDRFDFTPQPPASVPAPADLRQELAAIRQELDGVNAVLAAKFTKALTVALELAVDDQPIGDEKRDAIIRAITAALQSEPTP